MRSECTKSCGHCLPDSPDTPPALPAVPPPPTPDCDKLPDAGTACPFFFQALPVSSGRREVFQLRMQLVSTRLSLP